MIGEEMLKGTNCGGSFVFSLDADSLEDTSECKLHSDSVLGAEMPF